MEQLRIEVVGGWDGIGIETESRDGEIVVRDVVEETPAMRENIRIGDVIRSVDGKSTKGKKAEDVDKILNGKAGTSVQIVVYRPSSQAERNITLERAKVNRKNVPYYGMLSDKETGYVILTTFSERAGGNVNDAVKALQEEHKPKRFIIDLRNNGGGYLIEAVNICNIFVAKGKEIVSTRNKVTDWDRSFKTLNNPTDLNVPVIILINERSASASEIVAGALQDLDRGVIIGERSFGKGLVQTTKELAYGAKLKVTTARYYIPSGRCIQSSAYKDGAPVAIADSLRTAFKTRIGRKVLDGGGVSPDISLANPEYQELLTSLNQQFLLFDFATTFQQKNATLPDGKDFKLADKTFDEFIAFIQQKGYTFQRETDKMLDELEKKAKEEGLLDEVKADIAKMRAALAAEKTALLQKYKNEIIQNLQSEIVRRYYFERGRLENSLTNDPAILQALNIFADKTAYKKMLGK
jgi:carboxyl-terminal processing protease